MQDFELNMSIGSKYKLQQNYSENLLFFPEAGLAGEEMGKQVGSSLELEFDPRDPNIFYFSSSEGLFKCTRSSSPIRLDTGGLGSPSALSMSDQDFFLVGFTCGSIALYDKAYTSPRTIWYNACSSAITQIKWCLLHFNDDGAKAKESPHKKDR